VADDRWEEFVRQTLRGRHLREPSTKALRRALALGERLQAGSTATRPWRIRLCFDSLLEPLPVGVRAHAAGERRLLYEIRSAGRAGRSLQLDLLIRRRATGRLDVTGQLLPPPDRGRVEVWWDGERRSGKIGSGGEFLLRGMAGVSRPFELRLQAADFEVTVPDIPSGAADDDEQP